jgi:hypothetical protein
VQNTGREEECEKFFKSGSDQIGFQRLGFFELANPMMLKPMTRPFASTHSITASFMSLNAFR